MKDIQSPYNPYIVKFYVSTIFNFPSPNLLAELPCFLNNGFSYLVSHVQFSKSWNVDHLCPSPPSMGLFVMWPWASFITNIVGLFITVIHVHKKLLFRNPPKQPHQMVHIYPLAFQTVGCRREAWGSCYTTGEWNVMSIKTFVQMPPGAGMFYKLEAEKKYCSQRAYGFSRARSQLSVLQPTTIRSFCVLHNDYTKQEVGWR